VKSPTKQRKSGLPNRWRIYIRERTIPKSVHKERIIDNANVFDISLSAEDMQVLDGLNEDLRKCWDPTKVR